MAVLNLNPITDAYISQYYADTNFSAQPVLFVDRFGGYLYRSLMQFDLSALPSEATVTAATLILQVVRKDTIPAQAVDVYRNTSSFNAATVTWNTAPAYTISGSSTINVIASPQSVSTDVTTMVQGWHMAPATNYGITLTGTEGVADGLISFDSSEGIVNPVLSITYTVSVTETITIAGGVAETTSRYIAGKNKYSFWIQNNGIDEMDVNPQYSLDGTTFYRVYDFERTIEANGYFVTPDMGAYADFAVYVKIAFSNGTNGDTATVIFTS